MKSNKEAAIPKSSGNVFADLGFSPAESRNLRIRSEMMAALRKFIEQEGLTQAEAGKAPQGESAANLRSYARKDQPVLSRHVGQHAF